MQKQLQDAGIDTPQALLEMGSKAAWLKIKAMDPTACLMYLFALEGAVRGIRWHDLNNTAKEDLRNFYYKYK